MKQLSKHDVNKLTAGELKAKLPFQIVSDGEVIAVVLPMHNVNKLRQERKLKLSGKVAPRVEHDPKELRFSKHKQVRGGLS